MLLSILLGVAISAWGQGAIDAYEFDTDADAKRYQALIAEFRCPKCLNTNLSGSDAPIAADLRRVVYGLVSDGMSDADIRTFLQERYGDFVLYDPPMRADTIALWAVPVALGALAVIVILLLVRRRRTASAALDDDARAKLATLLAEEAPPGSKPR
ncbi:MAG: cytochrome c-type biogenesis protein CcmH [Gammaproteobacteria bacterium]|nr:cytochrome c-type biogenesis protein CcmH [Gammaproteobacteria bacterium]